MADLKQNFQLITAKPKNIEVPKGAIELSISVKELNVSDLERVMMPVWSYLNDYRKLAIDPAIVEYDKKVGDMTNEQEAKKLEALVNNELKKLVDNLQKQAEKMANDNWNKLKKANQAYTKYKVKIGAKITWGVIKIGKSIAALVASSGAKADEYFKIAKSCIDIAKQVKTALLTEADVREQVRKALEDMSKAKKDGKVGKSHVAKVKDTVKLYQQKLTGVRKKAGNLSKDLVALLDLQKKGVDVSAKQAKQIDAMIAEIQKFNTLEKDGASFAKAAIAAADAVESEVDLKTVLKAAKSAYDYGSKLKKAVDVSIKVFDVAAQIL
ncbi:MAG: hypothetical protein AAF713_11160 [Pseudomonadota bacterium]